MGPGGEASNIFFSSSSMNLLVFADVRNDTSIFMLQLVNSFFTDYFSFIIEEADF